MWEKANVNVVIRKAGKADASAVTELLRNLEFFTHLAAEEFRVTERRVLERISECAESKDHLLLVAQERNGDIAGYCAVHWFPYLLLSGPEGYVSELFVRRESRGHGIGSRLLEAVKTEALNIGCSRLMLLNMRSRESYERRFYLKQGWEERPYVANFVLHLVNTSP